jgi:hypothetical protein
MLKFFHMNKKQSFSAVLLIAAAMLTSTIGLYGSPIVYAQSYGGLGSPLGYGGLGGPGLGGAGGLGGPGGPGGLGSPLGYGGLGGPGLGGAGGLGGIGNSPFGVGGVGGVGGLSSVYPSITGSQDKPIFPLSQFNLGLCSSPSKSASVEPCISVPKAGGNFSFSCEPTSIVSFSCVSVSPAAFKQLVMLKQALTGSNATSTNPTNPTSPNTTGSNTPTISPNTTGSNATSPSPEIITSTTPPTSPANGR